MRTRPGDAQGWWRRPSRVRIQSALNVLLWLSTTDVDGKMRDAITRVRDALHDEIGD